MALNISPVHRNLHTRVSFLYLEFEDWFVVMGLAALTNVFGRWVDRQIFGIPINVFLQYIVPVLSIPFLMLFKYGKPGGTVRIITEPLGPLIQLRVEDEGMGLGRQGARLFDPFAQGAQANEGVGLGLALVKTIVEAHAGSITWRSGKGSYVGFTIPWSPN